MIDLDDPGALREADPSGMLQTVLALPGQCAEGYRSGLTAPELPSGDSISAVVVCGMGGSGVAGDVLAALYLDRIGVPIVVVKNPVLPEFAGKDVLVVCSSYSGNTAETLACFEEAMHRGCRLVAVSSGGDLARRAGQEDVPVVSVPQGIVSPRAAVGHLSFGVLGALEAAGVLPPLGSEVDGCARALERLAGEIDPFRPLGENPAKDLAVEIGGARTPVIWGAEGPGAVAALRWKTQLNENAKVPAFHAALPELDHNEVVGWSKDAGAGFFLVTLRHGDEHVDVAARFDVSVEVVAGSGLLHREIRAAAGSPLADLMWLIMLGDATSVFLGCLRGFDPSPIEAIDRIKRTLEERSE